MIVNKGLSVKLLLMDTDVAAAEGSSTCWLYSRTALLFFFLILMERTPQLFLCARAERRSSELSLTSEFFWLLWHRNWAAMAKDLPTIFLFPLFTPPRLELTDKLNQYVTMAQVRHYYNVKYQNPSLHWLWRKKLLPYSGNSRWCTGCGSAGCRGQKLLYSRGNYALKQALFQHCP